MSTHSEPTIRPSAKIVGSLLLIDKPPSLLRLSRFFSMSKFLPKRVPVSSRVLICVGLGKNHQESRELAYKKVKSIKFDGMYYRKDIGENRDI